MTARDNDAARGGAAPGTTTQAGTERDDDTTTRAPGQEHAPITPHEFIEAVMPEPQGDIFVTSFASDPHDDKAHDHPKRWNGHAYRRDEHFNSAANQYYSPTEVKKGSGSRVNKNFLAMRGVMLDDIGTKVDKGRVAHLQPTYRLETSLGNEQWGFAFETPLTNAHQAQRLLDGIKAAGVSDKGGVILIRWQRLPWGVNTKRSLGKPFPVRLLEFEPTRRTTPEALAHALGFALEGQRGRPANDLPPLNAADDAVLALLAAAGIVRDATPNARGFITIRCPWGAEHTGNDDSAGYKIGGAFHCFHGHCSERQIGDVLAWLQQQGHDTDAAVGAVPGPRGALLRALLDYAYVFSIDRFVKLEQGTFHDTASLDRWLQHGFGRARPSTHLLASDNLVRAAEIVYLPGRTTFLKLNETGIPVRAINTWRRGPVPVADTYDTPALAPWLDHLRFLFPEPEERLIVLDVLTHLVQRRGEKINWMLTMLAEQQGAKRDTLLTPIMSILGDRNVQYVDVAQLFNVFNEYELAELVYFTEADDPEHGQWTIYKKLKPKVVTPSFVVQINMKFVRPRQQPKVANYVMSTNNPAAIAMDRSDRRICAVESPYSREQIKEYDDTGVFLRLHKLYKDGAWLAQFHRYLIDRPLSPAFNPRGNAPRTPTWDRMFEASASTLDVFVADAIQAQATASPFEKDLARATDILNYVQEEPALKTTSFIALSSALRRAGAVKLRKFRLPRDAKEDEIVDGAWALRNTQRYAAMDGLALREAWLAGFKTAPEWMARTTF